MAYFLGIDTSTTSSKALILDERGEVEAVASSPHTLQTPRPLWSEQDPREWWEAVAASSQDAGEGRSGSWDRRWHAGHAGARAGRLVCNGSEGHHRM